MGDGKYGLSDILKRLIEKYWVVYYIVYVIAVVVIMAMQWQKLQADADPVFRLAAIFGLSAGIASFLAIVSEVFGRMVLLIPQAVKKLKESGRSEGKEEGRVEGRDEERARIRGILDRLDDGVPPEVVIEELKDKLSSPDSDE